jgi:hypothetical protein
MQEKKENVEYSWIPKIKKINLRAVNAKGPRSGRMNSAGPFKARTGMYMQIPSRQRRMSSSVADGPEKKSICSAPEAP